MTFFYALKSLLNNKFHTTISIVSFVVAIIAIEFSLGMYYNKIDYYNSFRNNDESHIVVMERWGSYVGGDEEKKNIPIEYEVFQIDPDNIIGFSRLIYIFDNVFIQGKYEPEASVTYVSHKIYNNSIPRVNKGRWFNEDEYNACIITRGIADKYFDNQDPLGAILNYNNMEYKIIGIKGTGYKVDLLENPNSLVDAYNCVYEFGIDKQLSQEQVNQIKNNILKKYPKYNVYIKSRSVNTLDNSLKEDLLSNLTLPIILLVFAIINILALESLKLEKTKRSIGISLAVGATRLQIFFKVFFENAIELFLAVVVDYVFLKLIENKIPSNYSIVMDAKILIIMCIISLIIALFMSTFILFKLFRKRITSMIKE